MTTLRRSFLALVPAAALAAALLSLPACRGEPEAGAEGPVRIAVSVPPLAWAARGLAPEGALITVLVPAGVSPHGFEPSPSQLAALHEAEVVVIVGLGLEPQVERALRRSPSRGQRVVIFATEAGVDAHEHDGDETHTHAHDDHDHGPIDPHLWLDPVLMESLIKGVRERIEWAQDQRGLLDDAELARLAEAEAALIDEVRAVTIEYAAALAAHDGAVVVTMHDAWGRLAERAGFRVAAELLTAGEMEVTPGSVERAASAMRAAGARVIIVEPQYDTQLARRLAQQAGAQVAELDPLGDGDWPAMMRANLASLVAALEAAREGEGG